MQSRRIISHTASLRPAPAKIKQNADGMAKRLGSGIVANLGGRHLKHVKTGIWERGGAGPSGGDGELESRAAPWVAGAVRQYVRWGFGQAVQASFEGRGGRAARMEAGMMANAGSALLRI